MDNGWQVMRAQYLCFVLVVKYHDRHIKETVINCIKASRLK